MKIKTILAAMTSALLAAGCVEEQRHEPEQFGNAPKIVAELSDEPQTRTTIDPENIVPGENVPVLWVPGDQLGVFSTGSANVLYINDEQNENVPNASFSSSANVSGAIQYAYYPYDEANDGKSADELTGSIPAEQTMGQKLPADYKYGRLKAVTAEGGYKFEFHNMFSLVRFKVDATGTDFADQTLESVTLTVTRNGAAVPVTGEFKFSAVYGTYEAKSTSNELKTVWNQKLDGEISSFATVFPQIKSGDKLTFTLRTADKKITFSADAKVDFEPEMYYTLPLKLSTFAANASKYGYAVTTRPVISNFSFEVKNNTGKLLNNKTEWSSRKPKFTTVTLHEPTSVKDNEMKFMIPYLYDYKLTPTFTAPNGAKVTWNGNTMTSGSTEVDFTGGATITVSTEDDYRDYKVTLSNTGLPVVVLKHSTSGDYSKVTSGGFLGIGATTHNQFVNFMIRGKQADWVEDDEITVYNPNGTVNMTANCGAKLRGNTTQKYPKKPFAIKLTSKKNVLGMPAHKRWVLLANWLDHSMIRNTVAFDIAHAIDSAWRKHKITAAETEYIGDGIPWNVHGQNVELVVFSKDGVGHHVGNYYLCEQIKIDGNRLDITDSYEDIIKDNQNPTLEQCGYLLEFDSKDDEDPYFNTSNGIKVKFKDDKIKGTSLFTQVQTKVKRIEDNLDKGTDAGYDAAYEELDLNTIVDQWLIWELTMNREYGDPGSVYMYMDGNGPLCAGPVWDFDRGTFQYIEGAEELGNSDRIKPYDEWMCWRSEESYIWYKQLIKSQKFQQKVKERWTVIYPYLQDIVDTIESYREPMRASYAGNNAMWPTTKADIQAHKSGFDDWSGDENINDWDDLIDNFKTVYEARLAGLNTLITSGRFTE